jgi:hypothetical protein
MSFFLICIGIMGVSVVQNKKATHLFSVGCNMSAKGG